jgi:hypothetical protein
LTAFFDTQATEIALEYTPPPAPGATRKKAAKPASVKVPLAPCKDQEAPIPDDWAMSFPTLENLRLIRHSTEPPNRLSRGIRYMLMDRARHRDISLDAFLLWIWQGKEDTPERQEWRKWVDKRPPPNHKIDAVLETLYLGVCLNNKDARIYRQIHVIKTTRVVSDLSTPRGQMTLAQSLERQRLLNDLKEKDPRFLGTDDFGTKRAVLFHVPMGKGKTT